jgi:hypothetical protein
MLPQRLDRHAGSTTRSGRRGGFVIGECGETGVLFTPGSVDELAAALGVTDWEGFDVGSLKQNAQRFSFGEFRRRLGFEIARILDRACLAPHRTESATQAVVPARSRPRPEWSTALVVGAGDKLRTGGP